MPANKENGIFPPYWKVVIQGRDAAKKVPHRPSESVVDTSIFCPT